ncbi:MAG: hypothetical protein IPL33_10675 [Sphingobacteriales bacterium]|nr:hypothetical protein [Sphingobacteriales bacterium]
MNRRFFIVRTKQTSPNICTNTIPTCHSAQRALAPQKRELETEHTNIYYLTALLLACCLATYLP